MPRGENTLNKLNLLTANLTAPVYKLICEETTYDDATTALENLFAEIVIFLFLFLQPLFREGCGSSTSGLSRHTSPSNNTLHFGWMKSETVPTTILDIIKPFCSWSSNWPLPTNFSIGKPFLRHSICMAKPSQLKSFDPEKLFLKHSVTMTIKHRNFFDFSQNSHFGRLRLWLHSFSQYPRFMTKGKDWNKCRLKHRQFYLSR